MTNPDECAVLVPSCDAYSDLWAPFFFQFFRNWPDCPFPLHLGSDSLTFEDPRVRTITANAGRAWSDAVKVHLESIESPFVLMMLDDFFLKNRIQTSVIRAHLAELIALRGHCMRLIPRPAPDKRIPGKTEIGEISVKAPYRVSTQGAIWRRETLLSLLSKGESIWSFETEGTKRSTAMGGFFGTFRHVLTYRHHVVQRGKWFPHEALRFSLNGSGIDLKARRVMSAKESLLWVTAKGATWVYNRFR